MLFFSSVTYIFAPSNITCIMSKSKIYTRTGDTGTTSLVNGRRVKKNDIRVEAYGTVDTLNSYIGVVCADCCDSVSPDAISTLRFISNKLFNLGAYLASDNQPDTEPRGLDDAAVVRIEQAIDALDSMVPPLNKFVLPGGNPAAAHAHVARTLCRDAERRIVDLAEAGIPVAPVVFNFMNRLSDYLFILARYINVVTETPEVTWDPEA